MRVWYDRGGGCENIYYYSIVGQSMPGLIVGYVLNDVYGRQMGLQVFGAARKNK